MKSSITRRLLISLVAILGASLQSVRAADNAAPPLTVYAAASLTNVLQELGEAYTRKSGQSVKFSFAGTATLARQIESGARADVFISADAEWMDYVAAKALLEPGSRRELLATRLVLIAPRAATTTLRIEPKFAIAAALGDGGRLSLADPQSVPAGRYAKAALESLGVWPSVASRLAVSDNVRTAMNFVARGEAPLGVVYETDARLEPAVKVLGVFPESAHPPIRYAAARLRAAVPSTFLEFLSSAEAHEVFARAGFTPIR